MIAEARLLGTSNREHNTRAQLQCALEIRAEKTADGGNRFQPRKLARETIDRDDLVADFEREQHTTDRG